VVDASTNGTAVWAQTSNTSGTGVRGSAVANGGTGVYGSAVSGGNAVYAENTSGGNALYAVASGGGYAGIFAGKVGIGTLAPGTELQIVNAISNGGPTLSLVGGTINGTAGITFGTSATTSLGKINYETGLNRMTFSTSSTIQMTLSTAGNLGLGVLAPVNKVHMDGAGSSVYAQWTNTTTGQTVNDGLQVGISTVGDAFISQREPHDLRIQVNAIDAFWINSTGKIGIGGAPDPSFTVLMYGSNPGLGLDNSGAYLGDVMGNSFGSYIAIPFENNSNILLMGGSVGIGMTPVSERLEVSGGVQIPAANDYKYATAKTHYYSVPSAAFHPESTTNFDRGMSAGSVYAAGGNPATVAYFVAPVNLPDGATVTSVSFYVFDNDATYNLQTGQLWRNDASTFTAFGNAQMMASVNPPAGNSSNIQLTSSSSISTAVIDNQNYAYYLRWGTQQSNSNMRIVKAVISYTVTKAD
jgi:hypothetical protein